MNNVVCIKNCITSSVILYFNNNNMSNFIKGHSLNSNHNIKKDEIILGLSCYLHDSSACFLKNGKIIFASQEERHTRIKNDNSFPYLSILKGLDYLKIKKKDIKSIIFHESLNTLNSKERNIIKDQLSEDLSNIDMNFQKIKFLDHHYSHAAAGYFSSNFKEALIFSFDGMGENISTSVFYGKNNEIHNIKKIHSPNSIGLLYSAFTYFLGFEVNSGEYKMMGLAPYGENLYENKIFNEIIELFDDGSFEINQKYFNFTSDNVIITDELEKLFSLKKRDNKDEVLEIHCDIAASIQCVIEKIIFKIIEYEMKYHKVNNVVLAGGVALNCVVNGKIERELKKNLHIFPSPGDSGNSFGCAVYATFSSPDFKNHQREKIEDTFFGTAYTNNYSTLASLGNIFNLKFKKFENYEDIVDLLIRNKIVGFFTGRSEFGPRSLGNRSILADPRNTEAQKNINLKIKFRESFRPFAPIVLEQFSNDYFENCKISPFMQKTYFLKEDKLLNNDKLKVSGISDKIDQIRSIVPAITHVDNSARVQTVSNKNSEIYKLLFKFYETTNCPMLINTSFNVNNEPIVETPYDALKTFINTNIDYLVIDKVLFWKNNYVS